MSETVIVTLPLKLFAAYGVLEGLARAASSALPDAVLADQLDRQLEEIERLWDNRKRSS